MSGYGTERTNYQKKKKWNMKVTVVPKMIIFSITVTLMFHSFFFLWQGLGTYIPFRFPLVLPYDQPEQESGHFFVVVDYHLVWSSVRELW